MRLLFAGEAVRLTREPADNGVNASAVFSNKFACDGSDIIPPPYIRPMLRQHLLTKRINLNLPNALPFGTLKAKIKAANSSEQRQKA